MRKRRTEITIETRKLMVIRTTVRKSDLIGCSFCGNGVSTIPDFQVLAALGLDMSDLDRLTNTGSLHRGSDGSLCGSSLAAYYENQIQVTSEQTKE